MDTALTRGRATPEGTRRFASRSGAHPGHFRCPDRLHVSSIGLGTRRGEPGGVDDLLYRGAIAAALESGCNLFNTAFSDRVQTSERALGAALRRAFALGDVQRDELVIVSKGGQLVPDPDLPGARSPREYLYRTYLESGLLAPEEIVNGSSIAPDFARDQIARSRRNLGLDTIDVYLVQEPEIHLRALGPDDFRRALIRLFEALEDEARAGRIGAYGLCTWDGFLVPHSDRAHLSLVDVFDCALEAGSGDHHMRALQLPYGLASAEGAALHSQLGLAGESRAMLGMLRDTGTLVMASAPLYGGRILGRIPEFVRRAYPEARGDAACGLQFVRSTAGIASAIVGMREVEHVEENLALAAAPPADPAIAQGLFQQAGAAAGAP